MRALRWWTSTASAPTALAAELDGALAFEADVTDEAAVEAAVSGRRRALGGLRMVVSCAGIGWAERTVGKQGPAQLQPFETVVRVNLIGTFNVLRLGPRRWPPASPTRTASAGSWS